MRIIPLLSLLIFLAPSNLMAECQIRSGRLLFSCSVDESRAISLYKEFLGSGKRRYVMFVRDLSSENSCDLIVAKEKETKNSSQIFSFRRGLKLTLTQKRRDFSGGLRGSPTPLFDEYVNERGTLSLKGLDCVRYNREK